MSPLHRRWGSKATSSASTSNMNSPLVNRTNTRRSAYSTTTAATGATGISNTTFLPEFHSTPPMPTLQKPHSTITGTPTPRRTNTTSFSMTDFDTTPTENAVFPRQKSPPSPPQPIFDNIQRTPTVGHGDLRVGSGHMLRGCKSTIDIRDRLPNTPELPEEWNELHDRAICILDTRDYTHEGMVKCVKRNFPELARKCLTPAMVDKQLRIMDQKYEIPYWRVGLAALEDEAEKDKKRGRTLSPTTAQDKKSQSPKKTPRRSGEADSTSSATQARTQSPSMNPQEDSRPILRGQDSAQDLWALMAQKEAEELAKITARDKEKQENRKPRRPRSKNDVEQKGAFPVRSKNGGPPVARKSPSRPDFSGQASASKFTTGNLER